MLSGVIGTRDFVVLQIELAALHYWVTIYDQNYMKCDCRFRSGWRPFWARRRDWKYTFPEEKPTVVCAHPALKPNDTLRRLCAITVTLCV